MSEREDDETQALAVLADSLGVTIRPEHLAEAARGWHLLAPHRQRVRDMALGPEAEPAPVFRP